MAKTKGSKDLTIRKHQQSFARQFLQDHNITIKQAGKLILKPLDRQLYKIKLPRTRIYTGEQFATQGTIKKIESYEELTSMGWGIKSTSLGKEDRWESGQRIKYELQPLYNATKHLEKIPPKHHVEYDSFNEAIRLVGYRAGPFETGPWISNKDKKRAPEGAGRKKDPMGMWKNPDEYLSTMYRKWAGEEEEHQPIYIDEVPFMITDSNEIVCVPRTPDMPSILISGMKGCLTKDTLISTPEFPKGIPMKSLLDKGPIIVNSYNTTTKKIEPKMSDGIEFAKHADIFELTTETGAKIKSTSDHPFLLSTNKYKKAIEIKQEDELVTVHGLVKVVKINHAGTQDTYDVVNVQDNHNFIANGFIVSNTGKSFALHSLVSRLFWKPEFNYKITILNDSSRETGTWCLPNNDYDQIHLLKRFNERPLPLPMVYFHPAVKEDYEKLYMGDVGFDITLPWKTIITHYDTYLNLKESKRYFEAAAPFLAKCKTASEAKRILDNLSFQFQMPTNTANKIRAELETLIASKMTDLSFEDQGPWEINKNPGKKYNPFTGAVHAGVIPVLSTEYISNYFNVLQIYFNFFAGDLFQRQKQDPDFLEEQSEMLFVVDECFTGDTMINTSEGANKLITLYDFFKKGKVLPQVLSYNEQENEWEYKKILRVLRKEQKKLIEISLGVSKIKTTHTHKMHTDKGWVEAKDLKVGELLTTYYDKQARTKNKEKKKYTEIKSIKEITHKNPDKPYVYDLTVEDNHNYIVCGKESLNGVLTHNCHNISRRGMRSTADLLLRRSVREGRPRRIGTLLATQKFNELPDVIKDNTTYLIVFKNPGEASQIANQYNLGKHVANTIKELNKHQCIAYTTEHFIVYTNDGRRRQSGLNEVFTGYSLPPYSLHKKPTGKGGESKTGDEEDV